MICPNCGKEIPESASFCRFCGCKVAGTAPVGAVPPGVPAGPAGPAPAAQPARKKRRWGLIAALLVLLLLALLAAALFGYSAFRNRPLSNGMTPAEAAAQYEEGAGLYDDGAFEKAIKRLSGIPRDSENYADAQDLLEKATEAFVKEALDKADEALQNGDWETAQEILAGAQEIVPDAKDLEDRLAEVQQAAQARQETEQLEKEQQEALDKAEAEMTAGHYDSAIETLKDAVQRFGASEALTERLAEAEKQAQIQKDPESSAPAATPAPPPETTGPQITLPGGGSAPAADFVFPYSSTQLLQDADIEAVLGGFDSAAAAQFSQLAINEIYARYGYRFHPELSATAQYADTYFNACSWYTAIVNDSWSNTGAVPISEIESANIDTILAWMQSKGYR